MTLVMFIALFGPMGAGSGWSLSQKQALDPPGRPCTPPGWWRLAPKSSSQSSSFAISRHGALGTLNDSPSRVSLVYCLHLAALGTAVPPPSSRGGGGGLPDCWAPG